MRESTRSRILAAARESFTRHGVRRTTMDDVAAAAGVTRTTVYRYFGDRRELIRAALEDVLDRVSDVVEALDRTQNPSVDAYLAAIGETLTSLPAGLGGAFDELAAIDPAGHESLRAAQRATIRTLFDHLYGIAEKEGRIRPGLDRRVVEVLFWETIIGLLEHPVLRNAGLGPGEVYRTVTAVLVHGLLVPGAP
jgi:AcrR family transcriptional regulator